MENKLVGKRIFNQKGHKWPLLEDYLQWKNTSGGRQTSMKSNFTKRKEDNFCWNTTVDGGHPSMEDDF